MEDSEKDSLWLLLVKQSLQESGFDKESEIGKWKLEIIFCKIDRDGWPSLESQVEASDLILVVEVE